jgi:hypothetical protein
MVAFGPVHPYKHHEQLPEGRSWSRPEPEKDRGVTNGTSPICAGAGYWPWSVEQRAVRTGER